MLVSIAEWTGALVGLLGALLLATHSRVSPYGWLAYLIANVSTLTFAVSIDAYGLMVQQVGFTATTLLGLYRSGLLNGVEHNQLARLTADEK